MKTTGFGSWIAARSNPYVSAGVDGMTTLNPGMWASSASRLCECWLPEDRPAPNWVRTVSAISALPPVMNGSFAAWLSSWSRHTPRKSRYISSTTGRMPAIAAPTPSPMIAALGDRGVSHAFTEAFVQPTHEAEHVATGRDVDPGDEDALVAGELHLSAARIASMVRNTGASGPGGGGSACSDRGRDDEVGQRRSRRGRQMLRRVDGVVELARHRRRHGCERVVGDPRGPEPVCTDEQRIACLPLPNLIGRSVALWIALVVTVPAVRGGLDDDRALSGARRFGHRAHHGCGRRHVVAVHCDEIDAVTGGALLELRRVLRRCGRELGVAVVLAEEDHRQLPHGSEVERFVEGTVGHRAVAEERHYDAAISSQLCRRRCTDRDRQAGSHDPVGAEDADRRVHDVHRPAAPAVRSLVLAHELGEHPEHVQTLREAVAVAAMGGRDHIVRRRGASRAHGRRLLPDREVHEARYLAVAVQGSHALLEPADHEHPPMHLEEVGVREHEPCIVLVGTNREGRCPIRSTSPRPSLVLGT